MGKKRGRLDKVIEFSKEELINIKNIKTKFKKTVKNYTLNEQGNLLYVLKWKYMIKWKINIL